MNKITSVMFMIVSIVLIVVSSELNKVNDKKTKLEKELDYYHNTFKSQQGGTSLYNGKWIDYQLISIDSGKTWYIKHSNPLVPIESRYPGFMKTLTWTKNLTKTK